MRLARSTPTPAAAREPATEGDHWRGAARDGCASTARRRTWGIQRLMERLCVEPRSA